MIFVIWLVVPFAVVVVVVVFVVAMLKIKVNVVVVVVVICGWLPHLCEPLARSLVGSLAGWFVLHVSDRYSIFIFIKAFVKRVLLYATTCAIFCQAMLISDFSFQFSDFFLDIEFIVSTFKRLLADSLAIATQLYLL